MNLDIEALPPKLKEAYLNHQEKKISLTDLERVCADFAFLHIEEFKPLTYPETPLEVSEYESLSAKDIEQLSETIHGERRLNDMKLVRDKWLKAKHAIKAQNNSNLYWLKEWVKYRPDFQPLILMYGENIN